MKNFIFIPAILLTLTSINSFADSYTCKDLTLGTIAQLTPDAQCNILQEKAAHYPDEVFLGPGACFSSTLTAMLGNTPITGTSYSGLTANSIDPSVFTAATVIKFSAGSIELGRVFTKDVVFATDAKELLTMTGGSKTFNGGYGNIVITGNALAGPTEFTGKLCTEN